MEFNAFAKILADPCYHKVSWFFKWQEFVQYSTYFFNETFPDGFLKNYHGASAILNEVFCIILYTTLLISWYN